MPIIALQPPIRNLLNVRAGLEDVVGEGAAGGEDLPEADEEEILDRLVERVKIKGGLNVDQLRRDGTIFEIDEEAVAV